jgi:photosystem II stability/assembly factor-like uncharacterized protein
MLLTRRCLLFLLLTLAALLPRTAEAANGRWTHLGPYGGYVPDVEVAPSAHRTLYAVADPGVYRSDNAGGRWRLVATGLLPGVSTLAVDPTDARIVYAGRGGALPGGPASLFKTVDGGATWTPLSGASGEAITDIAVDPHDPSRILAAGYQHLFRSEDGGATWETLDLQTGPLEPLFGSVAFDPVIPGVAYAAANNEGFLKSVDGGATWAKRTGAPTALSRLEVSPSGVLVAVPVVQFPARVFQSLDHGETWSVLGPIPDVAVYDFAFSPDGTLLAATTLGVFRKDAAGAGWTRLRPDQREEVRTIAADPVSDGTFYAGIGFYGGFRGVLKTRDSGATWRQANQGLGGLGVYSVAIAPSDPDVIYGSFAIAVLAKSTDGGATWRQLDPGFENIIRHLVVDPRNPNIVSGVGDYGLFVRSTNGGRTWTHRQIEDGECVSPFVLSLDPRHPDDLFVSGGQETACQRQHEDSCHTLSTSDGGASWDCLESVRSASFYDIVIDPRRSSTLYAAEPGRVFKSTDGGRTWALSSNGLPERVVTDLVIAPNGTLWAATGVGLFRSVDGARTWRRFGQGLPRKTILRLVLAPSDPRVLYAEVEVYHPEGSTFDLYVSTDRGATWRRLPEAGLPDMGYAGYAPLLVDPRDPGRVYVGTARGLYRLDGALD